MSRTLTVRDETTFGLGDDREFLLEVPEGRVTVRDLIRERVYGEVEDHNAHRTEHFRGLVQPTDAERTLNGFKVRLEALDHQGSVKEKPERTYR